MEKSNKQDLEFKDHCRKVQVLKIASEVRVWLRSAVENYKDLQEYVIFPPFLFDVKYPLDSEKRKVQETKIIDQLEVAVMSFYLVNFFHRLTLAIDNREEARIPLDGESKFEDLEKQLKIGDLESKREKTIEGKIRGMNKVLEVLTGDIPLCYWRRDLADKFMFLESTVDGGEVGLLATRIPQTFIRYYYAKKAKHPCVFVEISRFDK